MRIRHIVIIFSLLFCWAALYFYAPVGVDISTLRVIYSILLTITTLLSWQTLFYKGHNTLYYNPMRWLLFAMLFSIIPAAVTWGQPVSLTLRATLPFLAYIYFFFLYRYQPEIKDLEKVIWVLCIVYICVYLYSLYMAPTFVFGDVGKDINDNRGFFRFSVPGPAFLHLGFFLTIAKYIDQKKTKWIVFSALLFLTIILHVTRQYIFWAFVVSFFFLTVNMKLWKRIVFIVFVAALLVYAFQNVPIFQRLSQLTEKQYARSQNHREDVRVTSYRLFLFQFSPDVFTTVFGNGAPHVDSSYGRLVTNLKDKGLYMSDVGYAQIYALFGIIGLASFIGICYRVLRQKVPDKYLYAKMYIIYAMFSTFLTGYFLNVDVNGAILAISVALYILERVNGQSRTVRIITE